HRFRRRCSASAWASSRSALPCRNATHGRAAFGCLFRALNPDLRHDLPMDALDRAILRHLQADGRLTNVELAERVRLSPSPCLRRVRNLEQSGAIAGYHAVIDPAAVERGFQITVHATLMMRNRTTIETFEEAVAELDDVV